MKNLSKIKKKSLITLIVALIFSVSVSICTVYLLDYYKADEEAIDAFVNSSEIKEYKLKRGVMAFEPENPGAALVFYPGGKVEYTAYVPLMRACAEQGILCILVKMPLNLAVFDVNAAEGLLEIYPQIERRYIAGHSLGGAMASSYFAKNPDAFDGIILLGAYSTSDLTAEKIKALSIYGSEDLVMNMDKYQENRPNLPRNFEERIIEGGCHAYFGMYGAQDGDGTPSISNEEQIYITAGIISEFIEGERRVW